MFFNCNRKLQVTKGYTIDFRQVSNLLSICCRESNANGEVIKKSFLMEETGLGESWVENIASIMQAMLLIYPKVYLPTELGLFINKTDPFFKEEETLQLIHYVTASNYCNIVWYEIFNLPLIPEKSIDTTYLRGEIVKKLDGFSEKSLHKHVKKEVAEVIKAYTSGKLKKTGLITRENGSIVFHNVQSLDTGILMASLLIYKDREKRTTFEIDELLRESGAPGKVFLLDNQYFEELLFELSKERWISVEKRFNLNQIRIIYEKSWLEFLRESYNINKTITKPITDSQGELDFD